MQVQCSKKRPLTGEGTVGKAGEMRLGCNPKHHLLCDKMGRGGTEALLQNQSSLTRIPHEWNRSLKIYTKRDLYNCAETEIGVPSLVTMLEKRRTTNLRQLTTTASFYL